MNFIPLHSSSKGNAYLVTSEGCAPLLLEAGIPVSKIREKLNFGLSDVAGCLVSHEHGDHSKAVKDLLQAGVDVYTSIETAIALLDGHEHHRMNCIATGEQVQIGEWTVLPFDLHHDVPAQGFLIAAPDGEKLLFAPDTSYLRNRFLRLHIICVECNFVADILSDNIQKGALPQVVGHRVRRMHMSLDTVIAMLRANDLSCCREIWLLHMSDGNSDEALMIRKVQEATGIPTYACAS